MGSGVRVKDRAWRGWWTTLAPGMLVCVAFPGMSEVLGVRAWVCMHGDGAGLLSECCSCTQHQHCHLLMLV